MQSLIIVKPLPMKVAGYMNGASRVSTPDPKEAARNGTNSDNSLNWDIGKIEKVDTIFLGYCGFSDLVSQVTPLRILSGVNGYDEQLIFGNFLPAPTIYKDGDRHYLFKADQPFDARYITIGLPAAMKASFTIGTAMAGIAFQAKWGHEWGAGRLIEDTGSAERLFGGGFGIDDGVAASGYSWTFGDLQPLELQQLYQLVKDRRTTRSVLVVEDPDQTEGLNERIHWGLLTGIDAYERIDPINSRWALKIRDWA